MKIHQNHQQRRLSHKRYGQKNNKSNISWAFILFLSFVLVSGCQKKTIQTSTTNVVQKIILTEADIDKVKYSEVSDSFQATGELRPSQEYLVNSEVKGVVLRALVEEGDYVKKGQLLAVLDDKDSKDQLTQAQKALQSAESREKLNKITLDRKKQAYAEDLSSKQDLDTAQTNYEVAQKDVESAKAGLNLSETALQKSKVLSPVDGMISKKNVKVGSLSQMGESLFEIVQINPLKIEMAIPEEYMSQVSRGQKVEVSTSSMPDKIFIASINKISPEADKATRTLKVIASLPNPGGIIKANLSVDCKIQLSQKRKIILIPKESLIFDEELNKTFIYIVDREKSRIIRKAVKAEPLAGENSIYEIQPEDLKENDEFVKIPISREDKAIEVVL